MSASVGRRSTVWMITTSIATSVSTTRAGCLVQANSEYPEYEAVESWSDAVA